MNRPATALSAALILGLALSLGCDTDADTDAIDAAATADAATTEHDAAASDATTPAEREAAPNDAAPHDASVDLTDAALAAPDAEPVTCYGAEDTPCPADTWCAQPNGLCNAPGTCAPHTDRDCPQIYAPVCGCDGETYASACEAERDGASIASVGACHDPEGCRDEHDCTRSAYCVAPSGDCAGLGHCAPRVESCADVDAPACGCDGLTYDSACHAALAGISVADMGACEDEAERDDERSPPSQRRPATPSP